MTLKRRLCHPVRAGRCRSFTPEIAPANPVTRLAKSILVKTQSEDLSAVEARAAEAASQVRETLNPVTGMMEPNPHDVATAEQLQSMPQPEQNPRYNDPGGDPPMAGDHRV